jgi:hypothetical protein
MKQLAEQRLRALSQLNNVAVEVFIASATTPRLRTWFVKNVSTCAHRCRMSIVDVVNRQSDLCARGRLPLRRIEGKMKVGPFSPGDLCVPSAYPPVINLIVARVEV